MLLTVFLTLLASPFQTQKGLETLLDNRWGSDGDLAEFAAKLEKEKVTPSKLEAMIRQPRQTFEDLPVKAGETSSEIPLLCDHVDYKTGFFVHLPQSYKKGWTYPLLIVFHGGNSAMSKSYAAQAAEIMMPYWRKAADDAGYILAMPLTERGWSWIGTSATLSLISKLSRSYQIDPDRIYITGHSMGGHMTWRTAMHHPDRWAAVSPMSGGYDYVKDGQVAALWNVPGYATHGTEEPYEIADFNRKMATWTKEHRLDWVIQECKGGHTIFPDQIPKILDFFSLRPKRDIYRRDVFIRQTPPLKIDKSEPKNPRWDKDHTWDPKRPLDRATFFWVKVLEIGTKTFKDGSIARLHAINKGGNKIEVSADNVKIVRLYFHPKMADLSKPVEITLNGEKRKLTLKPDLVQMLRIVRESDDRGRIFYGYVDLPVKGDVDVKDPQG